METLITLLAVGLLGWFIWCLLTLIWNLVASLWDMPSADAALIRRIMKQRGELNGRG